LQLNIPSNQQGTIIGAESMLNFIAGNGVNIGISPNGTYNRADITISANAGQSVSSIGNVGSDTSIVIAGTGSGPYTGAITLSVPNWSSVVASQGVQMDSQPLAFCGSIGFTYDGSGGQVTLDCTQSPTAPALTVSTTVAPGTGLVFDSLFNFPGGNSGTTGQVLRLTSAPTGSTPGVLSWATIAGTGTVNVSGNGITGTQAASAIVLSTNLSGSFSSGTVTLTATGSGSGLPGIVSGQSVTAGNTTLAGGTAASIIVSATTPTLTGGGGNAVVGTTISTSAAWAFSTMIGMGVGQAVSTANNAINIGNAAYGTGTENGAILLGTTLFNQATGTLTRVIAMGDGIQLGGGSGSTDTATQCVVLGGGAAAWGTSNNFVTLPTGATNVVALGYGAMPTASNMGAIGYNVASGATGDTSFKLGIGKNTPVGTLHLGYAGGSNSEVSIYFDNNPGGASPTVGQIPTNGMIAYVAGTAGVPTIMSASCGKQGTQVILGYPTNPSDPSRPWVNRGDMLVGSLNPATGTGTGNQTGYFDIVPISNSAAGNVWKSSGTYASWGSVSLASSDQVFGAVDPINPVASTSYIALADPDDPNDVTDFELPVDYAIGSSFRVIGCQRYGWVISTALGSGVTQKIVYNNTVVTGDNDSLAGIQCNPAESPAAEYMGTTVELVYAKEELDGTQVWIVIYTQGVIDLFQSA